jgi:hypothetical protein
VRTPIATCCCWKLDLSIGFQHIADFNGAEQNGIGPYPLNVVDGVRQSTGIVYLTEEVRHRPNLTIRGGVQVDRVIFEDGHARGVRLVDGSFERAMYRAASLIWVTAARRSDEIRRLSVGCVRREWVDEMRDEQGNQIEHAEELCYLRVPTNKMKGEFYVPIPSYVADAIEVWESVRPPKQEMLEDRKTHKPTKYLFQYRNELMGQKFLNGAVIPLLCKQHHSPGIYVRINITWDESIVKRTRLSAMSRLFSIQTLTQGRNHVSSTTSRMALMDALACAGIPISLAVFIR